MGRAERHEVFSLRFIAQPLKHQTNSFWLQRIWPIPRIRGDRTTTYYCSTWRISYGLI
jgi:hypothetical protein